MSIKQQKRVNNWTTGDYTTTSGVISNDVDTGDGIFGNICTMFGTNKFLNTSYIVNKKQWFNWNRHGFNLNNDGVVEGELTTIVVVNGGSNYRNFTNVRVEAFETGNTTFTVNSAFYQQAWYITVDDIAKIWV